MYKFYDINNFLVMETQNPVWIKWDKKAESFKVCEYAEREGVLIQTEDDSYDASIEGQVVHPQLPVVRMVIE